MIPVVTIDGPTASGKGTVAQLIAERLGFSYLDSGALYRLTALSALRSGIAFDAEPLLVMAATNLHCRFDKQQIWLDDENVTDAIRAETVGNAASRIAALPSVRRALFDLQLAFRHAPGLVADGRDMGSVVFPDAVVKVFLTASVDARARRRYKQLIGKGFSASMQTLSQDLAERDERDSNRAVAPLAPAPGAHWLDSSDLTVEQVVEQILGWCRSAGMRD